jgi:hypothetical protein
MYSVRRVYLGKNEQLDTLSHACGELYSRTVSPTGAWYASTASGSNPST